MRAILLRAQAGPQGTMAWALQELKLHQQAERQWVPQAALDQRRQTSGLYQARPCTTPRALRLSLGGMFGRRTPGALLFY